MQFYRIDLIVKNHNEDPDYDSFRRRNDRDAGHDFLPKCERYAEKIADQGVLFLSSATKFDCKLGLIVRDEMDVEKFIGRFIKNEKIDVDRYETREITLNDISRMLSDAERADYIYDRDDVLREFDLECLVGRGFRQYSIEERMIKDRNEDVIYKNADRYFTKETLIQELDRIFSMRTNRKVIGHPVEYIIESDDLSTVEGTTDILLQALYNSGRILNRRFSEIRLEPGCSFSKNVFSSLYKSNAGGTVVLKLDCDDDDDTDMASGDLSFVEDMCEVIRRDGMDVLTIFCHPKECKNLRAKLFEEMGNTTFVEIREEVAYDETAIDYLKQRAKKYKVRTDKTLLSQVEKGQGYLAPDLNAIFSEWYSQKLKTQVFSQYKDFDSVKKTVKDQKPKGSAYDELESMIGLKSAKRMINQALDSYKAQKIFKEKGMIEDECCNHMIFTGNPGTAKTTVARLFARIMKDNGVLSRGHIVETGRGDLVGRYVGWTAPNIQKQFKKAEGGVLFIDEAYSLVDDRDGSYGDEAINTIVQEMENHRGDVIVIFAGYPDKMEQFLDKNPGLRSRIAHYIHFEDYSADELCQIAEHIAKGKKLTLDEGAMEKLHGIMEKASTKEDFGNGRYVRNIIEKAKMAQSSRLLKMDYDEVTPEDVKRICAEDIEDPVSANREPARQIGFVSRKAG